MDKYFGLEKEDFKRIIGDLIEQNEILKDNVKKIEETKKEKFNLESFLQDNVDTSGKI